MNIILGNENKHPNKWEEVHQIPKESYEKIYIGNNCKVKDETRVDYRNYYTMMIKDMAENAKSAVNKNVFGLVGSALNAAIFKISKRGSDNQVRLDGKKVTVKKEIILEGQKYYYYSDDNSYYETIIEIKDFLIRIGLLRPYDENNNIYDKKFKSYANEDLANMEKSVYLKIKDNNLEELQKHMLAMLYILKGIILRTEQCYWNVEKFDPLDRDNNPSYRYTKEQLEKDINAVENALKMLNQTSWECGLNVLPPQNPNENVLTPELYDKYIRQEKEKRIADLTERYKDDNNPDVQALKYAKIKESAKTIDAKAPIPGGKKQKTKRKKSKKQRKSKKTNKK